MTTNPNTPEFETVNDFIEAYENACDSVPCAVEGHQDCRQRTKDSFKQAKRLMILNEVIGEDETNQNGNVNEVCFIRNGLRRQMRIRLDQALTKYFGEE